MGSGFQRTADSSCKGSLESAVMVLLKVVPHNLFISPINFFSKNRRFS
jgi:hypothetical protein